MRNIIKKINWSKVASIGLTVASALLAGASAVVTSKQIEMEVDEKIDEKFSEASAEREETEDEEES